MERLQEGCSEVRREVDSVITGAIPENAPASEDRIVADPRKAGKCCGASGSPVVTAPTGGADGGGGAVDAREGGPPVGS